MDVRRASQLGSGIPAKPVFHMAAVVITAGRPTPAYDTKTKKKKVTNKKVVRRNKRSTKTIIVTKNINENKCSACTTRRHRP